MQAAVSGRRTASTPSDSLFCGLYCVRQAVPAGLLPTTPDPADIDLFGGQADLASADQTNPDDIGMTLFVDPRLAFGSVQWPLITGVKWNDFDGDGVWDPGEPGLSNWTIRLSDVSGRFWKKPRRMLTGVTSSF